LFAGFCGGRQGCITPQPYLRLAPLGLDVLVTITSNDYEQDEEHQDQREIVKVAVE